MRNFLLISVLFGLAGIAQAGDKAAHALDVFKTPSCGCCVLWIDHLEESGFTAQTHHPDDINEIKDQYGISPRYRSCHTGVSKDGYVFEGHVPAKFIERFLASPPAGAIGLSVPGMPLGSPGMEVDDRFMAYEILVLNKDGSTSVYAKIESYDDQF